MVLHVISNISFNYVGYEKDGLHLLFGGPRYFGWQHSLSDIYLYLQQKAYSYGHHSSLIRIASRLGKKEQVLQSSKL